MKQEIIRKSLILIGASNGISQIGAGSKLTKAENLCEEFVSSVIEEVFISVKWPFALKRIAGVENNNNEAEGNVNYNDKFKQIENITDCLKVASIAPSNTEWYVESDNIFFKGSRIDSLLYYSKHKLNLLLNNDINIIKQIPESFKILSSLLLVSQISFAMYSDSLFSDGLKKQYLIKLEEAKRLYNADYNIINSGEV